MLDEPLSSLDVRARGEIRTLLRKVLAGFGGVAMVVTHDPVDAMTLADDIVILENGRVTQAGTVDALGEHALIRAFDPVVATVIVLVVSPALKVSVPVLAV